MYLGLVCGIPTVCVRRVREARNHDRQIKHYVWWGGGGDTAALKAMSLFGLGRCGVRVFGRGFRETGDFFCAFWSDSSVI